VSKGAAGQGTSAKLYADANTMAYQAYQLRRQAEQQDFEEALHAVVREAAEAVDAERGHTKRLTANAEGTVTAERVTDDRVRRAVDYLADCEAEEKRTQEAHADPEAQTNATMRVHAARGVLDRERSALETARQDRQRAEQALGEHRRRLGDLEAAHAAAEQKAANPGSAPRTSALVPGVNGLSDLDDDQRGFVRLLALAMAGSSGSLAGSGRRAPEPAKPAPQDWRDQLAAQDASKVRMAAVPGGGRVIIPPIPR
jgi:hypothetical protein